MIKEISNEHKSLFPLADLNSQEEKLKEELKEVFQELVDVLIVCGGLYRWCPLVAKNIVNYFWITDKEEAEVNRKWQINLKRKWAWNGKTYHHVKEADDE